MTTKRKTLHAITTISGYQKLVLAFIVAVLVFGALQFTPLSTITAVIMAWDAFALSMIGMMWTLFFTASTSELKQIVKKQDEDISTIFAIVLVSVCVSFSAAMILAFSPGNHNADELCRTIATVLAIASSWGLLHTIFTVRYAHLYYDESIVKHQDSNNGIDFPNNEIPDYIDFAYFSFVIGMTFQVSDVTISSKTVRRYALLHSLISFVFNTVIVALTVNIIAGLKK